MNNHITRGIIFALTAAAISGFSIFYNKLVLIKGIDPQIFNILKNGGVGIILTIYLLGSSRRTSFQQMTKSHWLKLTAIAFIGGAVPFILYFEGLRSVAAINANLIQKTMFLWIAAIAIPALGERINLWQVIGYILIAWSNLFIGGFTGFTGSIGEWMILAAAVCWSAETIIIKIAIRDIDSTIIAWARMMLGIVFIFAYVVAQGHLELFASLTPSQLLPIAGSILLLTGYVTSWTKALTYAPATVVSAILILATPITNILSSIFITHTLPQLQIFNAIGTIIGICLIAVLAKTKQHTPSPGKNLTI